MDTASSYPSGYDFFSPTPVEMDGPDPTHQEMHEKAQNAIVAMQVESGLNPSGSFASQRARFEDIEAKQLRLMAGDATGEVDGTIATGFGSMLRYSRIGGTVDLNVSITRTGANLTTPVASATIGTIAASLAPRTARNLTAYVTAPDGQFRLVVGTDGVLTLHNFIINTGGLIGASDSWNITLP